MKPIFYHRLDFLSQESKNQRFDFLVVDLKRFKTKISQLKYLFDYFDIVGSSPEFKIQMFYFLYIEL